MTGCLPCGCFFSQAALCARNYAVEVAVADVMGMIDVNGYNLTGQHNRKTEMTGMRAAAAQRELEGLTRTDWFLDKHRGE